MIRRIKSRVKWRKGQRVLVTDKSSRLYGRFGIVAGVRNNSEGIKCRVLEPGAGYVPYDMGWYDPAHLATEAEVRLATQEGGA